MHYDAQVVIERAISLGADVSLPMRQPMTPTISAWGPFWPAARQAAGASGWCDAGCGAMLGR
jgi:hypothetical protein